MKHIVLIGFKHVGKTSIGEKLAEQLEKPFLDLDKEVEEEHTKRNGEKLSVRQIVMKVGLDYFRQLENEVLRKVLDAAEQSIISLGGGTPVDPANREVIINHLVVNITADKSNIYERIMVNGRPAFFPDDEDPYLAFRRIWDERSKIYDEIAQITVNNNDHLDKPVQELKRILSI